MLRGTPLPLLPWQHGGQDAEGPRLQRLTHHRVVRVGETLGHQLPGLVVRNVVYRGEETHHLGNRERRMRVVQLPS